MTGKRRGTTVLALIFLAMGIRSVLGGDALYGRVVEVKSGEIVTFEQGGRRLDIRLFGIDVPDKVAKEAAEFLRELARNNKSAQAILEGRTAKGELVSRVAIQDPLTRKVRDAGWELVNAGWAVRQPGLDYNNGELSAAEKEAEKAHRGLWDQAQTR